MKKALLVLSFLLIPSSGIVAGELYGGIDMGYASLPRIKNGGSAVHDGFFLGASYGGDFLKIGVGGIFNLGDRSDNQKFGALVLYSPFHIYLYDTKKSDGGVALHASVLWSPTRHNWGYALGLSWTEH
jgi:hypothetical protein